nr:hypothetical protein [Actinomycetota bacterium]
RRARALHELLAGLGRSERAGRLDELRASLAELVADLESVGAPAAELRPLRELLAALEGPASGGVEAPGAGPSPAGEELDRLWDRALAVLDGFARPGRGR